MHSKSYCSRNPQKSLTVGIQRSPHQLQRFYNRIKLKLALLHCIICLFESIYIAISKYCCTTSTRFMNYELIAYGILHVLYIIMDFQMPSGVFRVHVTTKVNWKRRVSSRCPQEYSESMLQPRSTGREGFLLDAHRGIQSPCYNQGQLVGKGFLSRYTVHK